MKRSNNDTQRPTHYTCMASRTPRPSLLGFCVNACQDMSRRTGSSGEPSHHLCTGHTEPVLALVPPSLGARRQLRQGRFEVDDVQGADAATTLFALYETDDTEHRTLSPSHRGRGPVFLEINTRVASSKKSKKSKLRLRKSDGKPAGGSDPPF
ncbi:hypothetical protein GTR04_4846 [Trichophyton interdigitale]|nr:hypothetical protein GTR04_4846 [Trichophyton interdigitale]